MAARPGPVSRPGRRDASDADMKHADASPEQVAYRQAMGLLVRREHSHRELQRKLAARGTEPTAAEAALAALVAQGYQDDARFAALLVRTRVGAGYGPLHVRAELGSHGVAREVVEQVLAEALPDWPALAREALRRRYGERPPEDRAVRIKRGQFLQRRGFDTACIQAALRDPCAGD